MKKLFKVRLGKPTGGESGYISFSYNDDKKIKPEYFVIAKSFNEAGKMVMDYVYSVLEKEKSTIRVTEYGLENLEMEINVCKIELVTDELIAQ